MSASIGIRKLPVRAVCFTFGVLLLSGLSCRTTGVPSDAAASNASGTLEAVDSLPRVNDIINTETRPFIIFYHSPRCGYCTLMMRTIERDLAEFGPSALIYTVDLDRNPEVREAKDIGPVPVVLFYRRGREVKRWGAFRPGFILRNAFRSHFEG